MHEVVYQKLFATNTNVMNEHCSEPWISPSRGFRSETLGSPASRPAVNPSAYEAAMTWPG